MGNCIPGALCFVRLGLGVVCRSAAGDGCCSLSDGRGWAGEGSVHRSDLRLYFVTNTGFCNVTINGDAWKRGDIFRVGPLHRSLPVCVPGCSCDITLALARGGGSGGGAGRQLGTTRRCWVTPSCSPARMGISAENEPSASFTISFHNHGEAPTRAFSWLKVPTILALSHSRHFEDNGMPMQLS